MPCPTCESEREPVAFEVPARYREFVPESASEEIDVDESTPDENETADTAVVTSICPQCLTLRAPVDEPSSSTASERTDGDDRAFTRVSDAFPTSGGVPFALLLESCSSLATNRAAIEELLEDVERAGTDPLLAMDRLLEDPAVEPAIDLERRRQQLEQLLY